MNKEIPQTDEQKFEMYMKLTKREVISMLIERERQGNPSIVVNPPFYPQPYTPPLQPWEYPQPFYTSGTGTVMSKEGVE